MEKELFERLLKSAEQMVAIEKGELAVPPENIRTFKIPDVKHQFQLGANLRKWFPQLAASG